jgi:glycosyltransferase involved in cell wall biosynthesis
MADPGNIGDFADAVSAYIADRDLARQRGIAGELRSRDFSWDAINRTVADTYVRLVTARSKRSA